MKIWRVVTMVVIGIWTGLIPSPVFAEEPYLLGAEDVISLRIVTWDDARATYVPMDAVTGEYTVSAGGMIALPVVGRLEANGLTLKALSKQVATGLQASAGLFQPPVVSLQIATYRPFYILGAVSSPGAYSWRPQLSVSKALALAGGVLRSRGDSLDASDSSREISSLRGVQVELARLRARSARLEAELKDVSPIDFPEGLLHPDGPASIERIKAEENAIFDLNRESRLRRIQSNEALIELYQTELESLKTKLEGHQRQLALIRERVESLRTLMERGSVVASRLVTAERALIDLNSEELDLNTGIFRARQRVAETQRDMLQNADNRRHAAMTQLQETRHRIELETKREAMFASLAAQNGALPVEVPLMRQMTVRRSEDGEVTVLSVGPDDLIHPGDVFEVQLGLELPSQ